MAATVDESGSRFNFLDQCKKLDGKSCEFRFRAKAKRAHGTHIMISMVLLVSDVGGGGVRLWGWEVCGERGVCVL